MTREDVIKGLQKSAAYFRSSFDALYGTVACEKFRSWTDAIEQATVLLKAQEPMDAIVVPNGIDRSGGWWFQCPNCKMEIEPRDKYCRSCGQGVKWE